jgi:YebC/PmpR family DNA-binding regulatory protein
MSGHSKWHSIKHKKEATDAKRGKIFTRYIKEITIAARLGGGDPEANPRLRHAIDGAKSVNMPSDNIKKAIQRGIGELDGVTYEASTYEGYGPGGVAILVEVLTDNKNRSVAEVRYVFGKYNGNLGENGCVGWMFARKGLIIVDRGLIEEDELLEIVLESGAEDLKIEGETYEVITTVEEFDQVLKAIKDRNLDIESSEIAMIPSSFVKLEGKQAESMLRLFEKLEDLDDVQNVWANFDITEEDIENYQNS